MLKIQIGTLSGDNYDLEIPNNSKVIEILKTFSSVYNMNTNNCYLCHDQKELDILDKITEDSIKKSSKFILFDSKQYQDKSFPRVNDASDFNPSRYSDYFIKGRRDSSRVIPLFSGEDDENAPEFIDVSPNEIQPDQIEDLLQNRRTSPGLLMHILDLLQGRINATINNHNNRIPEDDISNSEEEEENGNVNDENDLPEDEYFGQNDQFEEELEEEINENPNYEENENPFYNMEFGNDNFNFLRDMFRVERGNDEDDELNPDDHLNGEEEDAIENNEGENEEDENENENENTPFTGIIHHLMGNNNNNNFNDNNENLANQMADVGIQNVNLSDHDNEVIQRIAANYDYDPMLVVQVYLACDKNEETTTMCLMSM